MLRGVMNSLRFAKLLGIEVKESSPDFYERGSVGGGGYADPTGALS
jgi:hypothetical protein